MCGVGCTFNGEFFFNAIKLANGKSPPLPPSPPEIPSLRYQKPILVISASPERQFRMAFGKIFTLPVG